MRKSNGDRVALVVWILGFGLQACGGAPEHDPQPVAAPVVIVVHDPGVTAPSAPVDEPVPASAPDVPAVVPSPVSVAPDAGADVAPTPAPGPCIASESYYCQPIVGGGNQDTLTCAPTQTPDYPGVCKLAPTQQAPWTEKSTWCCSP